MTDAPRISLTRRSWQFCWRWTRRAAATLAFLLILYAAVVLVGLIPVNNGFVPADNGVEVLLISSAIHADIVLPITNEQINWRAEFPADCFSGTTNYATHIAFGWGDAGFYLHTPTWNDLRFSTAANAMLWPSPSCMHVGLTEDEYVRPHAQSVMISTEQYGALIEFIQDSFQTDEVGEEQFIPGAYGSHDAFFQAQGNYHALNTCNSWIGRALRSAGVRTPWLTPLPKTAFLYLPSGERGAQASQREAP